MRKVILGLIIVVALGLPGASRARVTAKDVQVAARVLYFTATPFTGVVKLGIVYDPAIATSAADKQALSGILGTGLVVGSVTLVPVLVPLNKLNSTTVDVLFLTAGLGSVAAEVGTRAAAAKILCITTDLAATKAGYCAVSVQSDPKVQITINDAAAASSGVSFAAAFLLMVTEI